LVDQFVVNILIIAIKGSNWQKKGRGISSLHNGLRIYKIGLRYMGIGIGRQLGRGCGIPGFLYMVQM